MAVSAAESFKTKLGEKLSLSADLLCYFRMIGAAGIAAYNVVADEPRNWPITALVGANYSTDVVDGWAARLGAKWSRRPLTNRGKTLDQETDKFAHYMDTTSHIVVAVRRGEKGFATVLAAGLLTQLFRDTITNGKRRRADKITNLTGLPIHIGSIGSSKKKMLINATADTATQSPLADDPYGRIAIGAAHLLAAEMSLTSGADIVNQLDNSMAIVLESLPADSPNRPEVERLSRSTGPEKLLKFVGQLVTV